jgi:hypothetical protein
MQILNKQKQIWSNTNIVAAIFIAVAIVLCILNISLPHDKFDGGYTHFNNYIIFKQSFFHLLHNQNLYAAYPAEQFDFFKYSPTFALFFGILAWMPDWLGLGLWYLLNVWVMYLAILKLPQLNNQTKVLFAIFIVQELVTTTMNSQSNAFIAGLLILGWCFLEQGRGKVAAWLFLFSAFIKIFGILFFILFLFYPKWYKYIIPSILMFLVLLMLPAPLIGFGGLKQQYFSYSHLLAQDNSVFVKYSVMGWLHSWFQFNPPKNIIILIGFGIELSTLFVLLFNKKLITIKIRAMVVASLLIWLVIFNHMAESATYIIAVAGVLIWFFNSEIPKWWRIAILLPVILFTCFGPSDIYPPAIRHKIVEDWQLKAFPCILVWCVCLGELMQRMKTKGINYK